MGAGFNQAALFHDKYLVSITNRGQAMGDHYNCFILDQLFKGFLNQVSFSGSLNAVASSRTMMGASFTIALAMAIR